MFAHYSGRHGAERMEAMRERMLAETGGDVVKQAGIFSMFARLRALLRRFWGMARDLFAGKNVSLMSLPCMI